MYASKKPVAITLPTACAMLDKVGKKYSVDGYRGGARIADHTVEFKHMAVALFRHPTKKATRGRQCKLTVAL